MRHKLIVWIWTSVRSAGWAPAFVFVFHVAVSRGLDAYLAVPELDIPMHFAGGVAIAFFLWRSVNIAAASQVLGSLTPIGRLLLTVAAVCTSTVVWEFAEWTSDRLGWSHSQLGLDDTLLDMLLGITGGMFFLVVSWRSSSASRVAEQGPPADAADSAVED